MMSNQERTESNESKEISVRRVGSWTCGVLLIVFGVLFAIHVIVPTLTYESILKAWPLILISLGVEILWGNYKENRQGEIKIKYDIGAVLMLIILLGFAMTMGVVEFCMEHPYWW
ncbi:MAG: LiaI-LiaF-like domain-containing protein [Lachnospiraceae bacterium]